VTIPLYRKQLSVLNEKIYGEYFLAPFLAELLSLCIKILKVIFALEHGLKNAWIEFNKINLT
jgi:hypothetical protein